MKAAARANKLRAQERQQFSQEKVAKRKVFYGNRRRTAARLMGMRWAPGRRLLLVQRQHFPLSTRYRRAQWVRQFTALEAIRSGGGTVYHAQVLAGAANIAVVLADWGLGWEYDLVLSTGQRIVNSLARFVSSLYKPTDPLGKRGVCPLDAVGLSSIESMLEIHTAQLAHPDCTRLVLARADNEVFARAERKRRERVPAVLKGQQAQGTDTKDITRSMKATLRRLRELAEPEPDGELDMLFANLETFFAVATAVIEQSPAEQVRKCALRVAQAAEQAAAEAVEGEPA